MNDSSFNYSEFVSKSKSLLVAPAGYGKTHTISECLKHTQGKQLILTHTHAGVASLKEKIKKAKIPSNRYQIETITSYAQKYVHAFYCGNDIPDQENSKEFYPFLIKKATEIIRFKVIKRVIQSTYSGLFVDEYQDCTKSQHNFLKTLSESLSIHILGDPLQGIFSFNEELVNWDTDFEAFSDDTYKLTEPWRWKNTNIQLGKALKDIRGKLENKEAVNLSLYSNCIETILMDEQDIIRSDYKFYGKVLDLLKAEKNLLLISPQNYRADSRLRIVKKFNNMVSLVEAIDNDDFYVYSKEIDSCSSKTFYHKLYKICRIVFNQTELSKWLDENKLKPKRGENKILINPIENNIAKLEETISFKLIFETLKLIKGLPKIKCYRKELFSDLCKALEQADSNGKSVYETMKEIRNVKRRVGRTVKGKCIGTTLLTKGLEFETVVVLNAHKFPCEKNLYVALTRASKKLVIFTKSKTIAPFTKQ